MTLSNLTKEPGIAAVPHGFRSSFRDWAAERTDTPREVVEAALAHTVRNPTEAAYARSDLFANRSRLTPRACSSEPNRSGNSGRYFRVRNCDAENGLSLLTRGRE